ncbi:MAG: hypothetical protein AAF570_27595, partial [Bacteroidota bacterium]
MHTVRYFFDSGALYKIELTKTFPNRKHAQPTISAFRQHYERTRSDIMELEDDKKASRFIVLQQRELHEVTGIVMGKKHFRVTQVAVDLDRIPAPDLVELNRDKHFISMINK